MTHVRLDEASAPTWAHAVATLFGTQVAIAPGAAFGTGSLRTFTAQDVHIVDVAAGANRVTSNAPAPGYTDHLAVVLHQAGPGVFTQAGHAIPLAPGTVVVMDPRLPGAFDFAGPHRQRIVLVPRALLPPPKLAHPTDAADPVDRLLAEAIAGLDPGADPVVTDTLLAGVLVLARGASPFRPAPAADVRMARADAAIGRWIADPTLTPDRVAAAQGVSRRRLDAVLARHGTSIARRIQERRLEEAARRLRVQPERSVLEIAIECGFSDATRLAHAFRRRYGTSPTAWRRTPEAGQRPV